MSALFHLYLCGRIAAEWLINMKYEPMASTVASVGLLLDWNNMSKETEQEMMDKAYVAEFVTNFPEPLPQLTYNVRLQLKHLAVLSHDLSEFSEEDVRRVEHMHYMMANLLSKALIMDLLSRNTVEEAATSPYYHFLLALKAQKDDQLIRYRDLIENLMEPDQPLLLIEKNLTDLLASGLLSPAFRMIRLKNDEEVDAEFDLTQIVSAEYIDKLFEDFNIDGSPITNEKLSEFMQQLVQFNMAKEVLQKSSTVPVKDEDVEYFLDDMVAHLENMTPEKRALLDNDDDTFMADAARFFRERKAARGVSQRESEKKQKQRERELKKKAVHKRKKK